MVFGSKLIVLGIFLLLEIYFFKHVFLYVAFFSVNAILLFSNRRLLIGAILPAIFTSSIIGFSTLIVSNTTIQLLFLLNALFLYWHIKTFNEFQVKKTATSLLNYKNTVLYGNFLAFFFSSSLIYGLYTHLSISLIWLLIALECIIALLLFNILDTYRRIHNTNHQYVKLSDYNTLTEPIIVIGIALFEICLVVAFLPFNYVTLGLLASLTYYVSIGMLEHFLKDSLDRRGVKLYLGVGIIGIILTVITTRWL